MFCSIPVAGSRRRNAVKEILSSLWARLFVLLTLLNVKLRLSVPWVIALPIKPIGKRQILLNFFWIPPASLTRVQLSPTQRTATKPQVGEMPISPAWALLGQHGHLQAHPQRTPWGKVCRGTQTGRAGGQVTLCSQVVKSQP